MVSQDSLDILIIIPEMQFSGHNCNIQNLHVEPKMIIKENPDRRKESIIRHIETRL